MLDIQKIIADADAVRHEINSLARDIYLMHHDAEPINDQYNFQKGLTERSRKCWDAAVIVYYNTRHDEFSEEDVYNLLCV